MQLFKIARIIMHKEKSLKTVLGLFGVIVAMKPLYM